MNDTKIICNENEFLVPGLVHVKWVRLHEGWVGEYNSGDPEDTELLRFDVRLWDKQQLRWYKPKNASFCTQMPVEADRLEKIIGLVYIAMKAAKFNQAENLQDCAYINQGSW